MKEESKESLISIQPYFVLASRNFCQRIYVKNGISHFFSFSSPSDDDFLIPLLVDGCCNLIFEYKDGKVRTHFIGITSSLRTFSIKGRAEYFGVRLQPDYVKFISEFNSKELLGNVTILDDIPSTRELCVKMLEQNDFESRINTFLKFYEEYKNREDENNQKMLFKQISKIIIQHKGQVKISELETLSGYTSRYINKIFDKEIAMSPKQFCSAVKFQFMLNDINTKHDETLTELATDYKFYDQAHFINEFREYVGKTPREYRKEVEVCQYCENVHNA